MITIDIDETLQFVKDGVVVKTDSKSLPTITESTVTEFCPFVFGGQFEFTVFVDADNSDWKNDKSEFMFKRLISSDSVNIELFKNGVKVSNLNNNDYGIYFNSFSGTASQQLQKGYLLNWKNVFDSFGYGKYTVKANLNIVGNASTWESDVYNVVNFSEERANRTVSIVSVQNGNIMSSIFDYTGLEWKQQIRLNGTFYEDAETFEKNAYRTQDYKQKQIQDEIVENWVLRLDFIPRNVSEFFIKDRLLANDLRISDYTLMNEKVHNLVGVYPESIEKTRLINNRNSNYLIKFTSSVKNIIKRNF